MRENEHHGGIFMANPLACYTRVLPSYSHPEPRYRVAVHFAESELKESHWLSNGFPSGG